MMRVVDLGSLVRVDVSRREVEHFMSRWPCSGLRPVAHSFTFERRNGDLVDMKDCGDDGSALVALSQDAWVPAARFIREGAVR